MADRVRHATITIDLVDDLDWTYAVNTQVMYLDDEGHAHILAYHHDDQPKRHEPNLIEMIEGICLRAWTPASVAEHNRGDGTCCKP